MESTIQFGPPRGRRALRRRKNISIEPELKAFLDDFLIPALVREALADLRRENSVEPGSPDMQHFAQAVTSEVA